MIVSVDTAVTAHFALSKFSFSTSLQPYSMPVLVRHSVYGPMEGGVGTSWLFIFV